MFLHEKRVLADCHQVPQPDRMSKVRGRGQATMAETCHPGQPKEQVPLAPQAGGT